MADDTDTPTDTRNAPPSGGQGSQHPLDVARETFGRVAEEVKGRYEQVTGDVHRRAERASEDLRRGAETARRRYDDASDTLREGYAEAQQRARLVNRDLDDFVQENPGRAVLMAAAAGFLVGLLLRGRD